MVENMTPTEKLIAEARELANAVENCIGGDNCDGCKLKSYMLCDVDRKIADSLIALCDALEQAQATLEQTWEWDMYKAAQKEIERLRKELAALAIESVKREKTLAKLEAEVMAAMNRRGKWTRKETNGGTLAICSQCKYPVSYWHKTKYCGECGANMEEVE